jgi:hypothetical protein
LTSDLAWLIGAGFAPLVALGVASRFGLFWVSAYLLSGVICTWAALLFNKLEMREMSPDSVTSQRDTIRSPGQYWAPRPR